MSFFVEKEYNTINMNISSLYLHVPFCRHLCNYCDFFKYREGSQGAPTWSDFEAGLLKSYKHLKQLSDEKEIKIENEFRTFYMGGGTPSLWGERGIHFLEKFLNDQNISLRSAQVTLEIDPGTIQEKEMDQWLSLGVNRFSLGLQTLDEEYLKIADRAHTPQEVNMALDMLKQKNTSFSADFLLGLPKLDKNRDVISELDKILSYNPEHLSLYILTVPKTYAHFHLLPSEEEIEAEYLIVSKYLTSKGFEHYEVSNFAKPHKESKHNFIYWNGESYLGLGPSATGQWRVTENNLTRYKWNSKLELLEEDLGKEDLKLESLYLAMRTKKGFDNSLVPQELISKWLDQGLITKKPSSHNHFRCSAQGFLIVDSMIDQVFSHQKQA